MEFCKTDVFPELDFPPALMANGHLVGHDDNIFTLTFVQSVPKCVNDGGDTVTMKYMSVGNIALSHRQAKLLAERILQELKGADGDGPDKLIP